MSTVDCTSLSDLEPVLKDFLPKELYNACYNEEDGSLDTTKLPAWYGDREDLVESVLEFGTFPGSDTFFGKSLTSPYNTPAMTFKSLKKKEYAYKHDILVALQCLFDGRFLRSWAARLMSGAIGYFLKCEESFSNGRFDLVEYTKKELVDLMTILQEQAAKENFAELPYPTNKKLTLKQHFQNWKSILPAHKDDPKYEAVYEMLKDASQHWTSIDDSQTCQGAVLCCKSLINRFKKLMEIKPEWFMSTRVAPSTKVVIRLFEENKNRRFIFVRELLNSMKKGGMDVTVLEEEYKDSNELATIDFKEANSKVRNFMNDFEIVIVPIDRILRRVTYIPTWDGKYCVPVADVIIEILDDLMRGKQILQLTNVDNFKEVFSIFDSLEELFGCKLNKVSYIDVKHAKIIKQRVEAHFDNYISSLPEHKKEVKLPRAGIEGEDCAEKLKDELKYLGIAKNFPISLHLVDKVFENIPSEHVPSSGSVESLLRTNTVETAIIQHSLPNVMKFLHFQGACNRNTMQCRCKTEENPWGSEYVEDLKVDASSEDSEKEAKEDQTDCDPMSFYVPASKSIGRKISAAQVCKELYKFKVLGRTRAIEVRRYLTKQCHRDVSEICLHCFSLEEEVEEKRVDEQIASEPKGSKESEKQMKKREKRRRQADRRKNEKEEQRKAPQKESKVCEKCIRTSNYCMEANAKLKEEKITTKALKKELKEKDQKILELEEMVARLQLQVTQSETVSEDPSMSNVPPVDTISPSTSAEYSTTFEKPEDQPSSSEEEYQVRCLTPTYKYSEHTPEIREKLHELIAIREFLPGSFYEATDLTGKFIRKTTNPSLQAMARRERRQFGEVYESYLKTISSNIEWIRNNKEKTVKDKHFQNFQFYLTNSMQTIGKCLMRSMTLNVSFA